MKFIPHPYNESIRSIDERLLGLIRERKAAAGGKPWFPPKELLEEWSVQYGMKTHEIGMLLHSLNAGTRPELPDEAGELLTVLPIMKRAAADGYEYTITHAMQHEKASIVSVEVRTAYERQDRQLLPTFMLEITAEEPYAVSRHTAYGSSGRASAEFQVSPRLPERVEEIRFSLIPYGSSMEGRLTEVILAPYVEFH